MLLSVLSVVKTLEDPYSCNIHKRILIFFQIVTVYHATFNKKA